MALTDAERLRQMLGESIPEGGTDEDTLFTNEQIADFLVRGTTLEHAAYHGWVAKVADLANLANTTEGQSRLDMGKLSENAEERLKFFQAAAELGSSDRRVKIKTLRRS